MPYDLPDYEKRVVVVTVPGEYPSLMEVDVKKVDGVAIATPTVVGCLPVSLENVADVNLQKLLGATIKTPTVANCVPVSVEHTVDINHKQILGEALKTPTFANCVPTSIENDAIAYDASNDRFKVDLEKISATDILAVSATDLDIRALVSTDVVTVKSITDALPAGTNAIGKLAANSGVDIGDVDVKTMPDVTQSDETKLKATVTQAAKDRTISSVDATATPLQINITGLNGNSSALVTPASGKKIRVKFISFVVVFCKHVSV